jgi:hypothetical protein
MYTLEEEKRLYEKVFGDPNAPASATRSITVLAITVTFNIDKRWVKLGETANESVTFSGKVTADTTPVAGVTVSIGYYYGGKWNWIRSTTTASDGTYSLSTVLKFGEVLACLDYDWAAFSQGTYSPYKRLAVAYNTRVRALSAPSSVAPNEAFTVSGYLERETALGTWGAVAGATVSIFYNTTKLGDATTGSDGYFSLSGCKIPTSGTYTLKASYAGADIPAAAVAFLGITVTPETTSRIVTIAVPLTFGAILLAVFARGR